MVTLPLEMEWHFLILFQVGNTVFFFFFFFTFYKDFKMDQILLALLHND